MNAPRPIIIDCDPGHDDAVALLLALASPELEVLGITTTHGNVSLERTSRNALRIREFSGANVPVFSGAERPLLRDAISAEHVHGQTGLGGVTLPEPSRGLEPRRAAEFIVESVMARPGEVTLVPTGPLTNIALALRLEPRLAESVREIALMGGSSDHGNTTPAAEFNIYADPHAARIVFESGAPLRMFGLNVTHQVRSSPERVARVRAVPNRMGPVVAELLTIWNEEGGAALHDPCPVAYLIRPELFDLEPYFVEVDILEGPNFGRTVVDLTSVTGRPRNVQVAMRANAEGVFDLLTERLARYS
ncbi:purine nucleosidase [Deinobacterium chartae]|uniref:Purine nucleosidase n=1 Tax=Deinobacterium chartae TaxID=521158 RepID=A0A841I337_9DEIO|nr:purine nucleosidase [Deinobacterium chartae]